ncbi:MAG: HAMP domain-containing protein [Acidobacteria bacterium]|jgi:nitrogen fixation/metabolism regulation signal transduction histidine kinase|nr:HAMP domain-containing protein [Acidobacteriota bacterium]
MADEKPIKYKPRVPPWILGGLVLILFTVLVLLQTSNYWKDIAVDSTSDTLLLYALSSLNFFAFIIFGFIFVRSLVKLSRERRAFALGYKIKTRLLLYFFAISLLPIIVMAFFSYLFMNRALDRWFTDIPENVIREARQVQNQSIEDQIVKLSETAQMLTTVLDVKNFSNQDLQTLVEAGNLTRLEVLSKDGKILAESEKNLSAEQKNELENTLKFVRANNFTEKILADGKNFDVAVARFPDGKMLVIVPDLRPEGNVSQIVENSLIEFEKLKQTAVTIRQTGLLTLGMLTFLLIFASSWTAFYIARGLTVPIKALAEGADKVARGDLKHRVDVFAEDELALLVSTFNQMSAKLEENSAELSERRRYIETILQSLSTGVISFDGENRVTTINKAAIEIFKLETADFTRFELGKIVNEENRTILERLINRARRIGQASEQTVLQREHTDESAPANESLSVALTATALPKTSETDASGVVLVIEDLSELIAAQRASAWQEVARRMAHEIKNPLTPIQLSAERIAKRFALTQNTKSKVQSFLEVFKPKIEDPKPKTEDQTAKVIKDGTETILREVNSLKSMVDEFSRYARLPNARLESGKLNEIIKQSVTLYDDRFSDVEIELNLAENLPSAMIDDEQLRRVFVNLIENATEAFDKTQTDKRIFVKTFHDAARDLIVAEVSDNGNGISLSDFQKLFQPYFSTKGRGTGLGLAIVQRIISEHRGKIRAVNNSTKGAKFIVELPTNV